MNKVRDNKGNAYLVANVEQFGEDEVLVKNGSKVIFNGKACDFVSKYAERFPYTLCADIRNEDGKTVVCF